jgi:succinoglycan biosynthesis protein ExoA
VFSKVLVESFQGSCISTLLKRFTVTLDFYPSISIAIPVYNEALDIERVVKGFLSTSYPNLIEILISDGGSTDGSQEIVKRISAEDSRVKLLHNPLKIQSAGLNLILQQCNGDVFLRADAHSDYSPDYIERCIEALQESCALNVGGAQRFVAKTPFQASVALASRSLIGNGGAKYRDPNYNGYADTVYLGCFWKKAILGVAGYSANSFVNEDAELNLRLSDVAFDLSQVTNQDAELNQRLLNQDTKAVYISSKIQAWYYPRTTWKTLWTQYFKYGRGRCLTVKKHTNRGQIRGKLPFLVISTVLVLLTIDQFVPSLNLPIEQVIILGLLLPFLESLRLTLKFSKNFSSEFWRGSEQEIPSYLSRWLFCAIALLTMPIAHFSGYAYQLVRQKLLRVEGW